MNNKRCGTCRHWRRTGESTLGECAFPIPESLPRWIKRHGSSCLETDGIACDAWDPSDDVRALCEEILQTLSANRMGGDLPFVDNYTFDALVDGWRERFRKIKA